MEKCGICLPAGRQGRKKFALLVFLTAANFLNQIFFVRRCKFIFFFKFAFYSK